MNNNQLEVIEWWYGRRDYRTGIELLSRYCKNRTMVNSLSKHGKEKVQASVKKLHYEVTKAVQLNWLQMPDDILPSKEDKKESNEIIPSGKRNEIIEESCPDTSFPTEEERKQDDTNQYPRVIRRLKYEYSQLYNRKSQLHAEMRLVEQTNTEKNNELRSGFLAEIKSISKQLAFWYSFLDKYEKTNIAPDEAEIWPPEKEQAPEDPKTLPELKKLMWSLRREYAKDGFRLIFQQRTKAEKENPMPKGSKRDAIELRMKLREIKLAETITLIALLENAG
jgi:hypothetical protein